MNLIDKIFDAIAWIKIFISPFIVGFLCSFFLWIYSESYLFKILAISVFLLECITGIYFAEKVRKKGGTQEFISRTNASKDFDQ